MVRKAITRNISFVQVISLRKATKTMFLGYSNTAETDQVNIVAGYFYAAYNFGSFTGAVWVTPMDPNGREAADAVIPGTYNDTFDTIEFDTTDHIMGIAVHEYDQGNIGELRGRWGNPYADIRMEKK